jgi:hypothetical protein
MSKSATNPLPYRTEELRSSPTPVLTSRQRLFSLAEFTVGAAIVIGHNVYHVVPNEVPILFVIGLISLRVRDGGWGVIGLRLPTSWGKTALFALQRRRRDF